TSSSDIIVSPTTPGARRFRVRASRSAKPRGQLITQAVAKHVERADGEQDREAREEREPGLGADEVPALADHDAPLGCRRLRPEPDEAEPCRGDDRRAHVEARLDEEWRDGIRKQVARQD